LEDWKDGRAAGAEAPCSSPSALPPFHPSILPISLFDFELPKNLIAQGPLAERDRARLLVVRRATGEISHHTVRDLPELLRAGDLLILNNTRVIPARLYGVRERTGGKWEGLYLRETPDGLWEFMSQTRGRLEAGEWIKVDQGLRLRLAEKTTEGHWLARPETAGSTLELLARFGHVPLPPYIRKGQDQPDDRERYQTVFAERPGAVAAPTAGLHFTPELFNRLEAAGVQHSTVTLHVGAGTFRPIEVENVTEHRLHHEWAELPASTAEAIHACRQRHGRIVAVGTTAVRTLETAALRSQESGGRCQVSGDRSQESMTPDSCLLTPGPWSGETNLYIYPPFQFQVVDALLTNFHLPRSSLLVLVSAFAGIDLVRRAYEIAIAERYRFYSYGDAMLIL
jgi:S-adenosylmethionine:tRNA ribosyltransferase-isomerase